MKHSIVILIAYFGQWPIWINFFIETCRSNKDIDWIIFSDCGPIENSAQNVKVIDISFDNYKKLVAETLRINFNPPEPYKICDIRPAFGAIHNDLIKGYDFIGFGDLDVFYGQIRNFYDYEVLSNYSVLSSHPERVSGHFFLMRNMPRLIKAFERVPNWKDCFSKKEHIGFDENHFTIALLDMKGSRYLMWKKNNNRLLFQERYSSPGPTKSMKWFWKDGILSNEFYCFVNPREHRGFLYLHFMDWFNNRWYAYHNYVCEGAKAPWQGIENIIKLDWRRTRDEGFMVSPEGISPIVWPAYCT